MNEFVQLFLIVSTFAFNAFCMNPSNLGLETPPSPPDVEFGFCFIVPEITSNVLRGLYDYHHFCLRKFPPDRPPRPYLHERDCYVVGSLKKSLKPSESQPRYDYAQVEQSLIQFTYLKETMVKFMVKCTDVEYKITFQSLQQSQAFYAKIYEWVRLIPAQLPDKAFYLLEVTPREMKRMGHVVKSLEDRINDRWYTVTFKDDYGQPILIFSQDDASMVRYNRGPNDEPQLLLRIYSDNFILVFPNHDDAKEFNNDLIDGYVSELTMNRGGANQ